jgi:hypothetical protein
LRETQAKPRLLVLIASLALAVALLFAALAVFAAEARAGSFGSEPPNAVLMKGPEVLRVREFYGGQWCHYQDTGWTCGIYDPVGTYYFPKADAVGAGTRLHVRLAKPEHPSTVAINACTKTKTMPGQPPMTGKFPAGQRQQLKHTFVGRVERDGETMGWNVFFRVNEPERQYYLVVQAAWEEVPGTHISYGDADYPFHVKTR